MDFLLSEVDSHRMESEGLGYSSFRFQVILPFNSAICSGPLWRGGVDISGR